jgi:hypothetical protein
LPCCKESRCAIKAWPLFYAKQAIENSATNGALFNSHKLWTLRLICEQQNRLANLLAMIAVCCGDLSPNGVKMEFFFLPDKKKDLDSL